MDIREVERLEIEEGVPKVLDINEVRRLELEATVPAACSISDFRDCLSETKDSDNDNASDKSVYEEKKDNTTEHKNDALSEDESLDSDGAEADSKKEDEAEISDGDQDSDADHNSTDEEDPDDESVKSFNILKSQIENVYEGIFSASYNYELSQLTESQRSKLEKLLAKALKQKENAEKSNFPEPIVEEIKPPFEMDSSEDDSEAEDYDPLNPFNIVNPPTTQGWVKNRRLIHF